MWYQPNWGHRVRDAGRAGLCVVFNTFAYNYEDEAGQRWRKEELTGWLDSILDMDYTVVLLHGGKTAFVFDDEYYLKLFMLHFSIAFKWEEHGKGH